MIADQSVKVIQWYWLSWKHKLATLKSFKADISSLSPMSFPLMKSKHSKCQLWNSLWWSIYITTQLIILNFLVILSHWCSTSLFRNLPPFIKMLFSWNRSLITPQQIQSAGKPSFLEALISKCSLSPLKLEVKVFNFIHLDLGKYPSVRKESLVK